MRMMLIILLVMVVANSQYVTLVEVPNDIYPDINLPDVNLEVDGCVDDLRKGKNPIFTTLVGPGERGMAVLLFSVIGLLTHLSKKDVKRSNEQYLTVLVKIDMF